MTRCEVVLVGSPAYPAAVTDWAAVQRWADQHGWETTRTVSAGRTWLAIATEDVLDGLCSPLEAAAMQALRADGARCVSIHAARAMFAAPSETTPASA